MLYPNGNLKDFIKDAAQTKSVYFFPFSDTKNETNLERFYIPLIFARVHYTLFRIKF